MATEHAVLAHGFPASAGFAAPSIRRRLRAGFWFLLPAGAIMALALGGPLLVSLYYSFSGWHLTAPRSRETFVGLDNYVAVLRSAGYWQAMLVTTVYAGCAVAIECALGMVFAILLNLSFFGRGLFRSVMLIPMVVTPAVIGIFWKLMYEEDNGLFNYFLTSLNLPSVPWLGVAYALASIILMDVWQSTPFFMLILLAGLQSLDPNIVAAAQMDGASAWQSFRYITLPHLAPYAMIAAAFRAIGALADFDKIFMLTFGGPGSVTTTVSLYAYNTGFKTFDIGRTTAVSWIFVALVLFVTAPLIRHLLRGASVARD